MSATQRGLSLIEVIIVIALIAVLMAISLPMLSRANGEARAVICRQNLADIGNAVTGHIRDYGKLPHVAELPPHQPGMSLPELVKPRLQTPNVMYCPSDETEKSHLLGTSYQWKTAYNGMQIAGFDRLVDQPLVSDRDAYHLGANIASNELVMTRVKGKYQFVVTGLADHEDLPSESNESPADATDKQDENDDDDAANNRGNNGNAFGIGNGRANGTGRGHGGGNGNTRGPR